MLPQLCLNLYLSLPEESPGSWKGLQAIVHRQREDLEHELLLLSLYFSRQVSLNPALSSSQSKLPQSPKLWLKGKNVIRTRFPSKQNAFAGPTSSFTADNSLSRECLWEKPWWSWFVQSRNSSHDPQEHLYNQPSPVETPEASKERVHLFNQSESSCFCELRNETLKVQLLTKAKSAGKKKMREGKRESTGRRYNQRFTSETHTLQTSVPFLHVNTE